MALQGLCSKGMGTQLEEVIVASWLSWPRSSCHLPGCALACLADAAVAGKGVKLLP